MSDIEIPRCHFCERLAPEWQFPGESATIWICERCMVDHAGNEWVLYQMPDGQYTCTQAWNPNDLSDWTRVASGTFVEMYTMSLDLSGEA